MKLHILTVSLMAGILATGCSDFLDGKSHDQVIVTTTKDYSELLYGSGYPSVDVMGITDEMSDDADWLVDQGIEKKQSVADDESFMMAYCWQPTLYEYGTRVEFSSTQYYQLYTRISGCNAVLDGIDVAVGTQVERDRVKAEALASRAYLYLQLVNLYGQPYNYDKSALGVPLKLTADIDEVGQPRNTVAEVYDFVERSLLEAIALMEHNGLNTVEKNYRINLPAMHTILSRVYLYEERWREAVEQASAALKLSGAIHDLTKEDDTAMTGLFSINSYRSDEAYWVYGNCSYSTNKQPSSALIDSFDANDVRFNIESGLYLRGILENDPNNTMWGAPKVYLGLYTRPKCNGVELTTGITVPAIAIRASEALINRAEAYAQLGLDTEAFNDVEKLRANRIRGYVSPAVNEITDMLGYVRAERRREFCFEGMRWFDLRRYGMPRIVHSFQMTGARLYYILDEKDPMYTLPLPSSVLELNPSLIQNESAYVAPRSASITF